MPTILLPKDVGSSATWELRLFGAFRLTDPEGVDHRLQTRKVEALLALLALNRNLGLDRDYVAEILWPERHGDVQRASMRQALSQLRKVIGEPAIEASRTHCRLSSNFALRCDFDEPGLRNGEGFMPGHEGDWFDDMRDELEVDALGPEVAPSSVVGTFIHTLNWFAANDPRAMFSLLRASSSLSRGIPPSDMLQMLNTAGADQNSSGWVAYWRGCTELDLHRCAEFLITALSEARKTEDWALASEVCLELGKVYSRTGRIEDAKRIIQTADSIATSRPSRSARANALRLKGTVLLHWGEPARGLSLLERSEEFVEDKIERTMVHAIRAFYSATAGLDKQAMDALIEPQRVFRETGHLRIRVLSSFTETLLASRGSGITNMHDQLLELSNTFYRYGWSQFGVYSDEMLAKSYELIGEQQLASQHMRSAAKGRHGSKMVRTVLENKLVEAVG
jgi:tetratricopeptide (TPR) repeat protein